jgi:hypothetical protein
MASHSGGVADQAQNEIVITGQRPVTEESARRFVRSTSKTVEGQLARYHGPICPTAIGIPPEHGARIVARMRRVAETAGLPVAAEGCDPNVTVAFAEDGSQFVRAARRAESRFFEGVSSAETRRLLEPGQPARAWRVTEVRRADGANEGPVASTMREGATGMQGSQLARTLNVSSTSIINLPTVQATLESFVVIEQGASEGRTLTQIADYALMRAVGGAEPAPEAAASGETILSLYTPGVTSPRSITWLDLAYLRALYATRGNSASHQHMSRIAAMMAEEAQ